MYFSFFVFLRVWLQHCKCHLGLAIIFLTNWKCILSCYGMFGRVGIAASIVIFSSLFGSTHDYA